MKISTNLAISADGKISPKPEIAGAFTSEADSQRFHELRSKCDALIVGRGTLEADRMTLLDRSRPTEQQPLRCVVSERGIFDHEHPLFHTAGGPIELLVTGQTESGETPDGARIHRQSLTEFLHWLENEQGVKQLHCEGGGGLIHALASLGRIDDFYLTLSARHLFGGLNAPSPTGDSRTPFLPASQHFRLIDWEVSEADEAIVHYRKAAD